MLERNDEPPNMDAAPDPATECEGCLGEAERLRRTPPDRTDVPYTVDSLRIARKQAEATFSLAAAVWSVAEILERWQEGG